MADKAAATSPHRPHDAAATSQRLKLQSEYGQAMMWAKGYAAEETKAALARAAELAGRTDDFSARFTALQGQYRAACTEGDLHSAREMASAFLREAEEAGRVWEAGSANAMLGLIAYWHGDFVEARTHCERALDARDANPNLKVSELFGDGSAYALSFLATTMWQLGEVERARELINASTRRASETGHMAAIVDALFWKSYLEVWRGDPAATLSAAEALARVAREHGMAQYLNEAELHAGWARGQINDPAAGAAEVRRVLAAFVDQGVRVNLGFYSGLLAQLEAETLGAEGALARIEEAFGLSDQVEHRCSLPFLHRLRGEILLKRDPPDHAHAEEAFRSAIAIAKEQGAHSPHLRAALALAKHYQTTGRDADAHAVLAPALEGFSPTPEMPEIEEAQALLTALAQSEEVKAAEAQRQLRLHLQTAYGQAVMWSKGFAAEETKAALARASEFSARSDSFAERFTVRHSQCTVALARGEHRRAREMASLLLKEAEDADRVVEAGVARRCLALSYYFSGDFHEARIHFGWALDSCNLDLDRETQERFSDATSSVTMSGLAVTMWQLGEVDRARELIEQANRRARELNHAPSLVHPLYWKSYLEMLRGDAAASLSAAEALEGLSREIGTPFWRVSAELFSGWARGRLHDAADGVKVLRRALAGLGVHGAVADPWFYKVLLAELDAETLGADTALEQIDEALARARQADSRCDLAYPHRLRGKILLKRDPSDPAAEKAFQTAIAIAKEQGAKSHELLAALSLAKLYQSIGRLADAHAVLAPALEGFSPTPEMPEIAEAQALLVAIEAGAHVRHE